MSNTKERANVRRLREALDKGEHDDHLLSGRDFNRRYWIAARQALSKLKRELNVAERERDALRAVLEEQEG